MSKRRMFSQSIVESDAFLDMPLTSQCLYFHLGMHADDDGFVNPKRIVRMIGASADDLQILIAKRFLLAFESGVVVVKHWRMNNTIRHDRYAKTTYTQELEQITTNEIGAYTEISKIYNKVQKITEVGNQPTTTWQPDDIPNGNPGKVKLSKVNISPNGLVKLDQPIGRDDQPKKSGMNGREFFGRLVVELGFTDRVKITETRLKKMKQRLNTYTAKELVQAARAVRGNAFLQGDNENGVRYGTIDYLLRNDEVVDRLLTQNAADAVKTFGVEDLKKHV